MIDQGEYYGSKKWVSDHPFVFDENEPIRDTKVKDEDGYDIELAD